MRVFLIILLYIFLTILCLSILFEIYVWMKFLQSFKIERDANQLLPEVYKIPYETLYIPTENNKTLVAWLLKQPEIKPENPIVIVAHGWTRNAAFLWPISWGLFNNGYTVLAMNARNHGDSELDPPMTVQKYSEDLDHVSAVLKKMFPSNPLYLVGHSLGGAAVLIHAANNSDVKKVAALCAFSDSREIFLMDLVKAKVLYFPFGWFTLKLIEFRIKVKYEILAPKNYIGKVKGNILLIHSEKDVRIPRKMQEDLFEAASKENKPRMVMIPDATHTSLLTDDLTLRSVVRFLGGE